MYQSTLWRWFLRVNNKCCKTNCVMGTISTIATRPLNLFGHQEWDDPSQDHPPPFQQPAAVPQQTDECDARQSTLQRHNFGLWQGKSKSHQHWACCVGESGFDALKTFPKYWSLTEQNLSALLQRHLSLISGRKFCPLSGSMPRFTEIKSTEHSVSYHTH